MSMDARTGEEHNELIFSHEGNARAAASVILIGVIAALIGSVFMTIGPKVKQSPRPASDASVGAASAPVRIVGQTPRDSAPCDQQVWPNIDQRCLVRSEPALDSGNTSSPARTSKLSPPPAPTTTAQPPSQDPVSGRPSYNALPPAVRQRDSFNLVEPSDEAAMPLYDEADKVRQQEFTESPPRKRPRRHDRSFRFHFGPFRF